MNDFKVGDRVTYVGPMEHKRDKTYTIQRLKSMNVDVTEDGGFTPKIENLRHATPRPEPIIIDRADLPEVTVKDVYGREYLVVDGSTYANGLSADEWRKSAILRYALAEFLAARDKAAEEAAAAAKEAMDKRSIRRDELAMELSPEASRANNHQSYDGQSLIGRRAIDRIIEMEDARG